MLAATAVMAVVLWFAQRALFAAPLHGWLRIAALAGLVTIGLSAYGVAAFVCGACDWRMLPPTISRRRTRQP